MQDPLLITASKKNRLKIDSSFLLWEQCTLLLWVLVPPLGQGLRDSPSNRYLCAHHTGSADEKGNRFFNQFSIRHTVVRERWEVTVSNNQGAYSSHPLKVPDALESGWHHFLIAWDRSEAKAVFLIDGGGGGSDLSRSIISSWPDRLSEKLTVGAWDSDYDGHYCETKLAHMVLIDSYLDSIDPIVKDHIGRKPRSA
ncbi:MAG: hypothetical protein KBF17_14035 [Candidatus Promineofilum sp.]|nr:hypothetical protein [Promineifilum sp.]